MANCSKCGKSVGCGCQLTNGVCASCLDKQRAEANRLQQTILAQSAVSKVKSN